jgi:hypothetical protein
MSTAVGLAEALEDFNSLRRVAVADADWVTRLGRLAQATFGAGLVAALVSLLRARSPVPP